MAVFYSNLKGLNSTGEFFNYLIFSSASNTTPVLSYNKNNLHETSAIVALSSHDDDAGTYGHLVCDAISNTFSASNIFNAAVTFGTDVTIASGHFNINTNTSFGEFVSVENTMKIASGKQLQFGDTSHYITYDGSTWTFVGNASFANKINANTITTTGSINAQFFNALSDVREKTNFKKLPSVLDIIKNTPVYSFNYKGTNHPAIGIIAQDVEHIKFDQFNLVSESGDGMLSIHESKLVYMLWKAIQEQQEEIEQLKAQLGGK